MLFPRETASDNGQTMRGHSELQKALHAPTRNRQLTVLPRLAVRPKPVVVDTARNTMEGAVLGAPLENEPHGECCHLLPCKRKQ